VILGTPLSGPTAEAVHWPISVEPSRGDRVNDSPQAAECLRLAGQATSPKSNLALIETARMWLTLADQAEKNSEADLLYETATPKLDGAAGGPAAN
jgi:hypothetical protein